MGGKTISTSNSQANSWSPNTMAAGFYGNALNTTANIGSQPYQPYYNGSRQLVAPMNNAEQNAYGNIGANYNELGGIQSAAGQTGNTFGNLAGQATNSAYALSPQNFAQNVQAYQNPYTQNVVNTTMANINQQNQLQDQGAIGQAIQSGNAFGGDRMGLGLSSLANQQNLASGQVIGGLESAGFNTATQTAEAAAQQQLAGLSAAGNLTAGQLQSLATQNQSAALQQGAAAQQMGYGTQQQNTQQARDTARYQQFQNRIAFPYQQASWTNQNLTGLGSQLGGAGEGAGSAQVPNGNFGSTIFGAGLAGASLLGNTGVQSGLSSLGGGLSSLFGGGATAAAGLGGGATAAAGLGSDIVNFSGLGAAAGAGLALLARGGAVKGYADGGAPMPFITGPGSQGPTSGPGSNAQWLIPPGLGYPQAKSPPGDSLNSIPSGQAPQINPSSFLPSVSEMQQLGHAYGLGGSNTTPTQQQAHGGRVGHFADGGAPSPDDLAQLAAAMQQSGNAGGLGGSPADLSAAFGSPPPPQLASSTASPNPSGISYIGTGASAPPGSMQVGADTLAPQPTGSFGGIANDNAVPAPPQAATGTLGALPTFAKVDPSMIGASGMPGGVTPNGNVGPTSFAGSPQQDNFSADPSLLAQGPSPSFPQNSGSLAGAPSPVMQGRLNQAIQSPGQMAQSNPSFTSYARGLFVPNNGASQGNNSGYAMPHSPAADVADLKAPFADKIQDLQQDAADAGIQTTLISGARDNALQSKLYQNYLARQAGLPLPYPSEGAGGVAAPPGSSYHNFGLAADVIANNPSQQGALIQMAKESGRGLHPLGAYDPPHIQLAAPDLQTAVAETKNAPTIGGQNGTLAYDGGRSGILGAPAAQAIQNSSPSGTLGGAGVSHETGATPGNFSTAANMPASNATPAQGVTSNRNFLGLDDRQNQALLAAGLGMMASRSPFFGQAVGEGGLAGLQNYMANTRLGMEQQRTGSEVGYQGAQTRQIDTENEIKKQQLAIQRAAVGSLGLGLTSPASPGFTPNPSAAPADEAARLSAEVAKNGKAPEIPGGPQSSAGPATAPTPPAPQKQIDPEWDPATLERKAQLSAWAGNAQAAESYRSLANQIIQSGRTKMSDGSWGPLPGVAEAEARTEGLKTSANEAAKAPYDFKEIQDTPGGPTRFVPVSQMAAEAKANPNMTPVGVGAGSPPGAASSAVASANPMIAKQPEFYDKRQEQIATNENEMIQQMQARQLSKQRLQTLQGIMQNFQPGAFAEQKADAISALRSVGVPVPDSATANPAAFQEFTKNAIANVFNDVKSLGGRVLVSEITGLTKANANPELQPPAAAAIIGQGLGILNYEDQHTKDYFDWKRQNPNAYDTSTFEIPWMQSHTPGQFVDQATKGIGYNGQTIPPPAQRTVGQVYQNAQGKQGRWSGTGWVPVP